MKKVDTNSWRTFRIIDVFNVSNTNSILSREVSKDSGSHPYLTASYVNNGVASLIDYKPELLEEGNCIFIGGKTLVITYQRDDFYSNDSHNLALRLKEHTYNTENVLLFMVTALRKTLEQKYRWSDSISRNAIKTDEVYLPATPDGKPDYRYMDSVSSKQKTAVRFSLKKKLELTENIEATMKRIDITQWQDFPISQLFKIEKGTRLTKKDMRLGIIRFIGASAVNNGITAYIANDECLHPANTITVNYNGSVGVSFYQDQPFWASDDVNVLYPKFPLNKEIAMFLIPIITKIGKERYEFIDKWKKEYMEKDTIKLPATANGQPDFAYMEETIHTLSMKVDKHFTLLNEVVK